MLASRRNSSPPEHHSSLAFTPSIVAKRLRVDVAEVGPVARPLTHGHELGFASRPVAAARNRPAACGTSPPACPALTLPSPLPPLAMPAGTSQRALATVAVCGGGGGGRPGASATPAGQPRRPAAQPPGQQRAAGLPAARPARHHAAADAAHHP